VRRLAALLILAVLAAGGLLWTLRLPYAGFAGEVVVDFPKGTSTSRMADLLAGQGVIRARWQFLLARAFNRGRKLQAGQYRFTGPASVMAVYDRIARGDVLHYDLVVPEGKNMFDIGGLAERLGFFSAARFVEAARDPALIRDLDPRAPSLEGYLFPSTYRLNRDTTAEQLCRAMTSKFREVWHTVGARANAHDTVTLASLVEKEGKLAEEHPLIAAVFLRRLEIGMKLDCDPTVIYAAQLDERWRGAIHQSDLENGNLYNTYQHAGLPPGPIANPGLASIRAVLNPADSPALYFVLRPDGSGGHAFSRTIASQQAAVEKYRRGLRKRK
jgi:UPF0755 protein